MPKLRLILIKFVVGLPGLSLAADSVSDFVMYGHHDRLQSVCLARTTGDRSILIAGRVPRAIAQLCNGIEKLPNFASAVHLQYEWSKDGKVVYFLGYTVESPLNIEIAAVRYEAPLVLRPGDARPWIEWVGRSLHRIQPPKNMPK